MKPSRRARPPAIGRLSRLPSRTPHSHNLHALSPNRYESTHCIEKSVLLLPGICHLFQRILCLGAPPRTWARVSRYTYVISLAGCEPRKTATESTNPTRTIFDPRTILSRFEKAMRSN
ncbi:hypothetical protein VTH06DRAFT_7012 [Thermothelomyces fergusii]